MGAACMLKMSPALFVVWWLVRREWVAVASAVAAAVVLSVLSLPFAGPAAQLTFYREVLPSFSSGDYNGLGVPITLFGNHSFPNVVHQLFPAQGQLSGAGRALSSMFALGSLAGLAWWFRAPAEDPFARAAQISAFGVLLLLVPVYTYEHHLVFALPAAVLAVAAAERGRLGAQWITPVALCLTVLFFDLQVLKAEAEAVRGAAWWLAGAIQELKFGALLGLLLTMAHLGGGSRAAVVA
jgi:alpha-1,2-mannosyltransferase